MTIVYITIINPIPLPSPLPPTTTKPGTTKVPTKITTPFYSCACAPLSEYADMNAVVAGWGVVSPGRYLVGVWFISAGSCYYILTIYHAWLWRRSAWYIAENERDHPRRFGLHPPIRNRRNRHRPRIMRIRSGKRYLFGEFFQTQSCSTNNCIFNREILWLGWQRRSDYCQSSPGGSHQRWYGLCRSLLCWNLR
jgi:hypothetical protein